jgi:hypothetical protein
MLFLLFLLFLHWSSRSASLKLYATAIFFQNSFPAALAVSSLISCKSRVSRSYLAAIFQIIDVVIQGLAQHVANVYCREVFVEHGKTEYGNICDGIHASKGESVYFRPILPC